jgi:hypothetical protein
VNRDASPGILLAAPAGNEIGGMDGEHRDPQPVRAIASVVLAAGMRQCRGAATMMKR